MRESLEKYKIVGTLWIDEFLSRLGHEEFRNFEARVNNALDKLGINKYYDISTDVRPEDQELFIKFCCLYIYKHSEYEFNEDFTQIWRKESYEQWEMERRRRMVRAGKRR
ncbi:MULTISPECIES: hypothetical protein [unclassified Bacteroides]|jgi:hypothetical protein|uniref:hypothetical protein n=1 Tax=Bacteroides TaxID=816 RepID=UPI000E98CF82|nr:MULTISPECIES: hypothetical protein [unclassified Bacteroides]RGN53938.1 hypothetical protein DXB58_24955 [Bacteroides sp. OM05-10AA]RGQ58369.1 hypothetical protein DWY87_24255 [Bacteroides sp. AF27-33]